MAIKPFQMKTTEQDRDMIALVMALYPNPRTKSEAVRQALRTYIRNADPVQLAEARRAVKRQRKEQA